MFLLSISAEYDKSSALTSIITLEYRIIGGGGKNNRRDGKILENQLMGVGIKGGWKSGWDRKQKMQIIEVDISNRHIVIWNSLFKAVPCISVRSIYFLCTAVN